MDIWGGGEEGEEGSDCLKMEASSWHVESCMIPSGHGCIIGSHHSLEKGSFGSACLLGEYLLLVTALFQVDSDTISYKLPNLVSLPVQFW